MITYAGIIAHANVDDKIKCYKTCRCIENILVFVWKKINKRIVFTL